MLPLLVNKDDYCMKSPISQYHCDTSMLKKNIIGNVTKMDFRQIISAFRHRHMQWSFMFSRFNGRPESRVSRSRRSICGSPRLCNRSAVCTLPLPAGIVPRGDPFARTVEMCFIVKFMFILFLPPTTAVQGRSGDGGGGAETWQSPRYPVIS